MILFFLIYLLLNINQINGSLKSCRQTFGSNTYDLNQLSHLTIIGQDSTFQYAFTPCGSVPTENCGKPTTIFPFEKGMTACQERIGGATFESPMGFLDGYGKSPNIEFKENPQGPGTGVVMTMQNAKCNGAPRIVIVTFICDKTMKNPKNMIVVEKPICQFTITVKAAEACPYTGSSKKGLSGGAVFIIILFVVIVVYLAGGILYNRYKQERQGLEVLPHLNFWLQLGTLFKTGCHFSWNFIRNGSQQTSISSTSYNSL